MSIFSGLFNNVRKVTPTADENMQMRMALLAAVMNSSEGKVLSEDDMVRIQSAMGIKEGIIDEKQFMSPLSRRELKAVIDIIDRAAEGGKLAAIEAKIDAVAETVIDAMQAKETESRRSSAWRRSSTSP